MARILKKSFFMGVAFIILLISAAYISGVFNDLSFDSPLLSTIYSAVTFLFRVNILWIGLVIFLENKNPSRTLAWLLVLVLIPVIGFFIYILFGRSYRKKRQAKAKILSDSDRMQKAAEVQTGLLEYMELPNSENPANKRLMQLLLKNAKAPLSMSNEETV